MSPSVDRVKKVDNPPLYACEENLSHVVGIKFPLRTLCPLKEETESIDPEMRALFEEELAADWARR